MSIVANLVEQTTTSTGTGNLTLTAVDARQTCAGAIGTGSSNTFAYFIMHQSADEWERGTGYMSDSTTLVRSTVHESSNSDLAVNFSAGTKRVTNAMPADELVTKIRPVADRTALKALNTSVYTTAYLKESGRRGLFEFRSGNYSSHATADAHELMYVVSTDTASSSGAWVRIGPLDMEGATLTPTTGVELPSGLVLKNGTLDMSGVATASLVAYSGNKAHVLGSGTSTQISDLASSPAVGDFQLTFASAHTLAIGDLICIYDPTDYSWSADRNYYRAGEYCRVVAVPSSTTVKLDAGLWASYDYTVVDIYKVTPWRGSIRDVTIKGNGDVASVTYGLAVVYGDRVDIDGVVVSDVSYTCISIDKCFETRIARSSGAEDGTTQFGGDYGLSIFNSQRIDVERCSFTSARHGITHGGGSGPGAVPVRAVHHRHNNAASASGNVGFDIHGNSEGVVVEDCRFPDGLDYGGRSHTFQRCWIRNTMDSQYCAYAGETHSGRMLFQDCDFEATNGTIANTSRGVFDVGGNTTPLTNLAGDVTFEIRDCRYSGNSANSVSFARLRNNSPTYKANIIIDGLDMDNASTALMFSGVHVSGMPTADMHVFKNIRGFAGGSAGLVSWTVNSYAQPTVIDVDYHGWVYRRPVVSASSTVSLDPRQGCCQYWANIGAHTIAAPTIEAQMMLEILNDTGAGAITFSGFTKVTGDTITTTVGHKFQIFVSKGAFYALAHVRALQ